MANTMQNDEFITFWNDVLVTKFERFRNILMGGMSYHSETPLRKIQLRAQIEKHRKTIAQLSAVNCIVITLIADQR